MARRRDLAIWSTECEPPCRRRPSWCTMREGLPPVDLYDAQTADPIGRQIRVVAQMWHVDSGLQGRFEHAGAGRASTGAIDGKSHRRIVGHALFLRGTTLVVEVGAEVVGEEPEAAQQRIAAVLPRPQMLPVRMASQSSIMSSMSSGRARPSTTSSSISDSW